MCVADVDPYRFILVPRFKMRHRFGEAAVCVPPLLRVRDRKVNPHGSGCGPVEKAVER
jgi:hypothetical protein